MKRPEDENIAEASWMSEYLVQTSIHYVFMCHLGDAISPGKFEHGQTQGTQFFLILFWVLSYWMYSRHTSMCICAQLFNILRVNAHDVVTMRKTNHDKFTSALICKTVHWVYCDWLLPSLFTQMGLCNEETPQHPPTWQTWNWATQREVMFATFFLFFLQSVEIKNASWRIAS